MSFPIALKRLCLAGAFLLSLSSCDGVLSGMYDQLPADSEWGEGLHPTDVARRFTLTLDAIRYDEWIYLDLNRRTLERRALPDTLTGEWDGKSGWMYQLMEGTRFTPLRTVPTDPQTDPEHWDLAFHRFDVRTHGGSVCETSYTQIDRLPASVTAFAEASFVPDEPTNSLVMTDLREMMAYRIGYQMIAANRVLSGWVKADYTTPPPVFAGSGKVYILRTSDGRHAALRLKSYVGATGTKGQLTIEVLYPYE